jgi:acetyl-CoA synthetase
MFRGYLNEDERYMKCFAEAENLGDKGDERSRRSFLFVGRADDVIKSANI